MKTTTSFMPSSLRSRNGQFEGTKYFYIPWELAAISNKSSGPVEKSKYGNIWKSKLENQAQAMFGTLKTLDLNQIRDMLKNQTVFVVFPTE